MWSSKQDYIAHTKQLYLTLPYLIKWELLLFENLNLSYSMLLSYNAACYP